MDGWQSKRRVTASCGSCLGLGVVPCVRVFDVVHFCICDRELY